MSLHIPNLDDRNFDELLAAALERIKNDLHTSWNDFTPGDPGMVLLETFSFLTEQMIYRLNRLPEKAYIAFLNMMGVNLKAPYPAQTLLTFWQNPASQATIHVPRGAQVATQGKAGEAQVFTTACELDVPPECHDENSACTVLAYNAAWVEEDLPAAGSGQPGQVFKVAQPPILSRADGLELLLGVEIAQKDAWQVNDWITADGRHFQVWEEVDSFAGKPNDARVFRVDRMAGLIQFAPAAYLYLAEEAGESGCSRQEELAAALRRAARLRRRKLAHPALPPRRTMLRRCIQAPSAAPPNLSRESVRKRTRVDGLLRSSRMPTRRKVRAALPPEPHPIQVNKQPLASLPLKDCVIHVRYPTGGGSPGNLPARQIETLLNPPELKARLKVTNLAPARGGLDAETLDNALVRGPWEIFSRERLVTARDFQRSVLSAWPEIARASAHALKDLWKHGEPGAVGIAMVPRLASTAAKDYTKEALESEQAQLDGDPTRAEIENLLKTQSPLGIRTRLDWARYKRVSVSAEVSVQPGVDTAKVKQRLEDMLYRAISPLPSPGSTQDSSKAQAVPLAGWAFGDELHLAVVSGWIYHTCAEVSMLRALKLSLDSAPDQAVRALAADHFQPQTWYAASGWRLFRSTNDAAGWEELLDFSGSETGQDPLPSKQGGMLYHPTKVCPSTYRAGLVAVAARNDPNLAARSPVYLSCDCGESWARLTDFDGEVNDMDWLQRAGQQILLLATSNGLQELHFAFDAEGIPHLAFSLAIPVVTRAQMSLPVNAVKVLISDEGTARVAVAMDQRGGVYLSSSAVLNPPDGSAFQRLDLQAPPGLYPADLRCLAVQSCPESNTYHLWAGAAAIGTEEIPGVCGWVFNRQLQPSAPMGLWYNQGWTGGSCNDLACLGNRVLAATARGSILAADVTPAVSNLPESLSPWSAFDNGQDDLPRQPARLPGVLGENYIPFSAIASNDPLRLEWAKPGAPLALAGCEQGVFRSADRGITFEKVSPSTFREWKDSVTIPPNWLLVSGRHDISIIKEKPEEYRSAALRQPNGKETDHAAG